MSAQRRSRRGGSVHSKARRSVNLGIKARFQTQSRALHFEQLFEDATSQFLKLPKNWEEKEASGDSEQASPPHGRAETHGCLPADRI